MFLMQFCLLNAVIPLDKVKTHRLVQHKSHKLLGQLRQAKVTVCIKKIIYYTLQILYLREPYLYIPLHSRHAVQFHIITATKALCKRIVLNL